MHARGCASINEATAQKRRPNRVVVSRWDARCDDRSISADRGVTGCRRQGYSPVHLHRCAATVGNLRVDRERRLVDQKSTTWNQIALWLSRLATLERTS